MSSRLYALISVPTRWARSAGTPAAFHRSICAATRSASGPLIRSPTFGEMLCTTLENRLISAPTASGCGRLDSSQRDARSSSGRVSSTIWSAMSVDTWLSRASMSRHTDGRSAAESLAISSISLNFALDGNASSSRFSSLCSC